MKKRVLALWLIVCMAIAAIGGAYAEDESQAFAVIDMAGREIAFDGPVTRVVALSSADCEILYAIGAGDALVGRGEYCNYPAEVSAVPSVQSGYETNIEQVIALAPQVIIMTIMAQTTEQIAALENAGVKVVVSDAQDVAGVYADIEMLGKLMGREAEAATVIGGMRDTFAGIADTVAAQAPSDEPMSVYFEVSPLEYGLWTAGSGTFMNEVAGMLGLKNCFDDVSGWAEISEEQVIERSPDFIVTISPYYGEGPTPAEEICSRAGWTGITAVVNNAILNLPDDELSRPSPRLADGAKMFCEFVYPE